MIARIRARLHGLRRGHQVYEGRWFEDRVPEEFQGIYAYAVMVPGYACHGCERRWVT